MLFILITEFSGILLNAVPQETASTTLQTQPCSGVRLEGLGEREGAGTRPRKGQGEVGTLQKTSVHKKQRKTEELFQIKEEQRHAPGLDSNDIIRATGETEYALSTR